MKIIFFILLFLGLNSVMAYAMTKIDLDVKVNFNDKILTGIAKISDYDTPPEFNLAGIEILQKELKKEDGKDVVIFEYKKDIKKLMEISGMLTKDYFLVLYDNWYPKADKYSIYNLKVSVPEGFTPISEADEIKNQNQIYEFVFNHPRKDMSLIVGRFYKNSFQYRDIELSTYFLEKDQNLSDLYLSKTGFFIEKYEKILGKFPFKKFSVVENPMQTGYGFPTFTLLGSAVLRLPFIPDTSLGHELVHSWWGNSIYNDSKKGNWIEGLTTYISDYQYEKEKNKDKNYRKNSLIKYMSYNNSKSSTSLINFYGNIDKKSESLGYGKGAFLFYTIEKEIGEKNFYNALKELTDNFSFKEANWEDLKNIFNKHYLKNSDIIFNQFLTRNDMPEIEINGTDIETDGKGEFLLKLTLKQKTINPYNMTIPVVVETLSGKNHFDINLSETKGDFYLQTDNFPIKLIIDPDYQTFRKLTLDEYTPVLSRVLGAESGIIVIHEKDKETYSEALDFFSEINNNYKIIELDDQSDFNWDNHKNLQSVVFAGKIPETVKKIIRESNLQNSSVSIDIINNITDYSTITTIKIDKKEEFSKIKRKLSHLGNYSKIAFSNGQTTEKEIKNSDDGIIAEIYSPIKGYNKDSVLTFNNIINQIKDKKIIFIGEQHDKYAHHLSQLIIIKAIFNKDNKLAVGMEMFQTPFQKSIDEYLTGKITETEFLVQSEYLKRWRFDYKLYKPIIDFCKTNNIKIIALNAPMELTKKISESGISSLSPDEQKNLPIIDITNDDYKFFLKKIFSSHSFSEKKDFSNFYLAQLLWDETMAETAHNFIGDNPDYKMIVIAGNGHRENKYGIPDRLISRGNYQIATISNQTDMELDTEKTDYSIFMPDIEKPFSALLGVTLEETQQGLIIKNIEKNSVAEKSNLCKNDIIINADGIKIINLFTLKAILSTKKINDTIKLKISRKKQENPEEYETLDIDTAVFSKATPMPHSHPK